MDRQQTYIRENYKNYSAYKAFPKKKIPLRRSKTPFMWYYYTPYGYGGYPYGVYS